MSTPLRQFLVFQLNRRRARPLQLNNRALDIRRVAKPVSASTITGMLTRAVKYETCCTSSVSENNPMSGIPSTPAENAAPDKYMAENPISSIIRPISAIGAPGA